MLRSLTVRSVAGVFAFIAALLLGTGCQSGSTEEGQQSSGPPPLPEDELAIENPWVQAAPAGSTSTLYMTVANGTQSADTLTEASAPIIGSWEVRRGGNGETSLAIPSRTRVRLQPDSTHVRLSDLGQSLDEGNTVVLNLQFAESGLQRVRVPVRTSPPSDQ